MSDQKCSPLAAGLVGFVLGAIVVKLAERFCPMPCCGRGEACCCGDDEGEGCCCEEVESAPEAGVEADPAV